MRDSDIRWNHFRVVDGNADVFATFISRFIKGDIVGDFWSIISSCWSCTDRLSGSYSWCWFRWRRRCFRRSTFLTSSGRSTGVGCYWLSGCWNLRSRIAVDLVSHGNRAYHQGSKKGNHRDQCLVAFAEIAVPFFRDTIFLLIHFFLPHTVCIVRWTV